MTSHAALVRFLGSGDAFGRGGRLQTAILLETESHRALVDCGATTLVGLKYSYDKRVPFHLSYRTLVEHRSEIRSRRIVLTHMSADMLERLSELEVEAASDGRVIEL